MGVGVEIENKKDKKISMFAAKTYYFEKIIAMKLHFAGRQTHTFHIVTEVHDLYLVHLQLLCSCRVSSKVSCIEFSFFGVSLLQWGLFLVCLVAFYDGVMS